MDLWLLCPVSPQYSPLGLPNVHCAPLGFGVRPSLAKRQREIAGPERRDARNGGLLWKRIFNTRARSGAACPNDLLTGQHFHSRHCGVEDSQAVEYFIFTQCTRFCMNYTKRINQEQSGLGSQLCLEICSVRLFISQLLSSVFPRWDIDFSFPLYFVWPAQIGLEFYSFMWVSAKCCPMFCCNLQT